MTYKDVKLNRIKKYVAFIFFIVILDLVTIFFLNQNDPCCMEDIDRIVFVSIMYITLGLLLYMLMTVEFKWGLSGNQKKIAQSEDEELVLAYLLSEDWSWENFDILLKNKHISRALILKFYFDLKRRTVNNLGEKTGDIELHKTIEYIEKTFDIEIVFNSKTKQ